MVMLVAVALSLYIAWQVRHLGLYLVLCDTLGVILGATAAMAYAGPLGDLIPLDHPLKGTACLLVIFLVGWTAFRSVARSFAGDWAVEFGRAVDRFGAMIVAFAGTMVGVSFVAVVSLTTGDLLTKVSWLHDPLQQSTGTVFTAVNMVAYFAGAPQSLSLDQILRVAAGG